MHLADRRGSDGSAAFDWLAMLSLWPSPGACVMTEHTRSQHMGRVWQELKRPSLLNYWEPHTSKGIGGTLATRALLRARELEATVFRASGNGLRYITVQPNPTVQPFQIPGRALLSSFPGLAKFNCYTGRGSERARHTQRM